MVGEPAEGGGRGSALPALPALQPCPLACSPPFVPRPASCLRGGPRVATRPREMAAPRCRQGARFAGGSVMLCYAMRSLARTGGGAGRGAWASDSGSDPCLVALAAPRRAWPRPGLQDSSRATPTPRNATQPRPGRGGRGGPQTPHTLASGRAWRRNARLPTAGPPPYAITLRRDARRPNEQGRATGRAMGRAQHSLLRPGTPAARTPASGRFSRPERRACWCRCRVRPP